MQICPIEDGSSWAIEWRRNLYVVALNGEGLPAQRYWGTTVPRQDWSALAQESRPHWMTSSSRPSEVEEEILPYGGLRWGISGVRLSWPSGDEELSLRFAETTIEAEPGTSQLRLCFTDPAHPALTVDIVYRVAKDHDVLERWAELRLATGAAESLVVNRMDSANWLLPELDDYRMSYVFGHWGGEARLVRDRVPNGEFTLTSRTGTTSHHTNPWVMIDDGFATEDLGTVYTVGLAWSGTWRMDLQRRPEGAMSVAVGAGHEASRRLLEPGQSVRSPISIGVVSDAGFGAASRAMHRYTQSILPNPDEIRPVLYNSWEATAFDVDPVGQLRLAEIASNLGVELFVVDDGWFGSRTSDTQGLGDWYPNPERFPEGLGPLVEGVRRLGMKFGLWVEPEMVNPNSRLYIDHPEWVMHYPGRDRRQMRNQLVLNFGRRDVRDWASEWLASLVREHELDFIKWDMNRPFSQAGWSDNLRDQGSLWFAHVEGVYGVIQELRAANPGLLVESCSGGGGRVDLGMARHVDWFWTSDNTDALDRQRIQQGFSQIYPSNTMMNWVTDSPNPITGRLVPLTYRFHVAMSGALGIGGDLTEWDSEDRAVAQRLISEYKEVRRTVQRGELHRLGGTPGCDRSALQYLHGDEIVVLIFEPRMSLRSGPRTIKLKGLVPDRAYTVRSSGRILSGAYLMSVGLEVLTEHVIHPTNTSSRFSAPDFLSEVVQLRVTTR